MTHSNTKYTLPLGVIEMREMIPHRYPFMLVDRVIACTPKTVTGIKNVSITDFYFQGHFPNNPVVPGVLIIEGIAQTMAIFGHLNNLVSSSTCYLTEVIKARFRQQAVPGDVLRYESRLVKQRKFFFWFDTEAYIGDNLAASAYISAYME